MPLDPITFESAAAVVAAVAALAGQVPARRASRIDPIPLQSGNPLLIVELPYARDVGVSVFSTGIST